MERKTAKMEAMEELHELTARMLTAMILPTERVIPAKVDEDTGEVLEKERKEVVMPSPAALAVARAFLKDNSVFATDEQSDAVGDLHASVSSRRGKRLPSAQDAKDALATLGKDLLQ